MRDAGAEVLQEGGRGEAWREGAGRNENVTPAEGYKGSENRFVFFFSLSLSWLDRRLLRDDRCPSLE